MLSKKANNHTKQSFAPAAQFASFKSSNSDNWTHTATTTTAWEWRRREWVTTTFGAKRTWKQQKTLPKILAKAKGEKMSF